MLQNAAMKRLAWNVRTESAALGFVLLCALAVRTWMAWAGQWSTDADRGIVHLMALHMSEGRTPPLFFYGQGYMGSLEPMISALLCRLFGFSSFMVAMGTSLVAVALLVPLYFLGRRIGGPWTGLLVAGYLAVGPDFFSAYMASPRGGYAVSLFVITAVLALAVRLCDAAWSRRPTRRRDWAALGFVAGLGWWTNPIVAPAPGAAAALLLVALRGRFWSAPVWIALAAFIAGASPWLAWNAAHGWESLSMTQSVGEADVRNMMNVMTTRLWQGFGWGVRDANSGPTTRALVLATAAALAVLAAVAGRDRRPGAMWALAATALYALLFGAAYTTSAFSRIETLRYLLPMVPVAAVLAGGTAGLLVRVHPALLLLALPIAIGQQVADRMHHAGMEDRRARMIAAVPTFVAQLKERGVDFVFADYPQTWITALAKEEVRVVESGPNRVPFHDPESLLARGPALWRNGATATFIESTRARAESTATPMGTILTGLRPAAEAWRALDRSAIVRVTDHDGADQSVLVDSEYSTKWRADSVRGREDPHVVMEFDRPRRLVGILAFGRDNNLPLYAAIDTPGAEAGEWTPLLRSTFVNGWSWSGPQPYFGNELYSRVELRFPPTEIATLRLRIPPSPRKDAYRFRISEIVLLEAQDGESPDWGLTPESAREAAVNSARTHVYANRWLSDRLAVLTNRGFAVDSSARLRRTVNGTMLRDAESFAPVGAPQTSVFFAPPGAADANARVLEEAGYGVRHIEFPGATGLIVTSAPAAPARFAWVGDFLFRDQSPE